MKNRLTITLVIALLLVATGGVFSQDADDGTPRAVVLQAIEHQEDGYQFTVKQTLVQLYGQEVEAVTESSTEQFVEGQFASNGDYIVQIATTGGSSTDPIIEMPPLIVEMLAYNDVKYVNLHIDGTIYEAAFPSLDSGWYNRDDLLNDLDDSAQRVTLEYLTFVRWFKDIPFAEVILSVEEQQPETIDDIELRVFEVQMDALGMLILQLPSPSQEGQSLVEELTDASSKGEFSLRYTFWIGANDGYLYRTEYIGRYYWPYEDVGTPQTHYDLEIILEGQQHVWDHGMVEAITLPDGFSS